MRINIQRVRLWAAVALATTLFSLMVIGVGFWLDRSFGPSQADYVERNNKVVPYCVICGYKNIQYEEFDECFDSVVGTVRCPECKAIGTISVEWIGDNNRED